MPLSRCERRGQRNGFPYLRVLLVLAISGTALSGQVRLVSTLYDN
jgi:hypothetical protein